MAQRARAKAAATTREASAPAAGGAVSSSQRWGLSTPSARLGGVSLALIVLAGCASSDPAPVRDGGSHAAAPTDRTIYTIQPGDTLLEIALDHGVDHNKLAAWNHIDSPDMIRAGQQLRLEPPPGGSDPPASSPAPSDPAGEGAPPSEPATASTPDANGAPGEPPSGGWQWPTEGDVVQGFSQDADGKQGITIGGDEGQPIEAAAHGEVVYSGAGLVGYGNLIILRHDQDFLTAYGYNSRLLVDEGDAVQAGDRIAEMGAAVGGEGIRLHFEIRRGGEAVDPAAYLP